jgi:hypothetical protein
MAVRRSDHVAEAAIAAARALMPSASLRRWSQIPPMSWARASVCSARRMWSFAIPRRVCAFKWLSKNATSKARGKPDWTSTRPGPGPPSAGTPSCRCAPRRCWPSPPPARSRPPRSLPPPAAPGSPRPGATPASCPPPPATGRPATTPAWSRSASPEARLLLRLAATPMSRAARDLGYAWSRWRRRHQARARWHHYHARLLNAARRQPIPEPRVVIWSAAA